MHIVYLHQYFVTNQGTSGTRSYDMARFLVERGHTVSLITGMHRHLEYRVEGRAPWRHVDLDGIDLYILNADYKQEWGAKGRVLSWLRYAALASALGMRLQRPDVTFASCTPPTVGVPALAMQGLRGVPWVYELRDVWPECLYSNGLSESSPAVLPMKLWNKVCVRGAEKLTVITPAFSDLLAADYGARPEDITFLPLGADKDLYRPRPDDKTSGTTLREGEIGADDLVAVYCGVFGPANNIDYLVDAAAMLRDRADIKIVLIGHGNQFERIEKRVKDEGLSNLFVRPAIPKHELVELLPTADVGIVCLRDSEANRLAMPNKMYDYMFSGLALLKTAPPGGGGILGTIVEENDCGAGVDATDPAAAATLLRAWADDREGLAAMGARGRALGEREFDRNRLAGELEQLLLSVVKAA
jgi:glycosyltransferase involved in cell wall biosynthesis